MEASEVNNERLELTKFLTAIKLNKCFMLINSSFLFSSIFALNSSSHPNNFRTLIICKECVVILILLSFFLKTILVCFK